MSVPTLNLGRRLETALASGHPWIYRNHLPAHSLATGDWVRLEAGRAAAFRRYDADGAIAVRLFARDAIPDEAWIDARVAAAIERRARLAAAGHDAYRLVYGEGDGLPAMVADRYARFVVLKRYSDGVADLLPAVARAVARRVRGLKGVVERDGGGLTPLWGELPPPEETIVEHGHRFLANLYEGQKTGLFLDHRENRRRVGEAVAERAPGARVLNLFAYSGGFSVYALAAGASHVTSVDLAAPALRDAKRNVALNDLPAERHAVVEADVFADAPRRAERGERYDVVVLDPPSLARSKAQRARALAAYRHLNAAALRLVAPGGLLVTASCTAQVSPSALEDAVVDAAGEAGVSVHVRQRHGHALDHPVPASFPEGRYLSALFVEVGSSV